MAAPEEEEEVASTPEGVSFGRRRHAQGGGSSAPSEPRTGWGVSESKDAGRRVLPEGSCVLTLREPAQRPVAFHLLLPFPAVQPLAEAAAALPTTWMTQVGLPSLVSPSMASGDASLLLTTPSPPRPGVEIIHDADEEEADLTTKGVCACHPATAPTPPHASTPP